MKNGVDDIVRLQTGHVLRFYIGDIVYLKTDPDQYQRIVTGVLLLNQKSLMYRLSFLDEVTFHFETEISSEKNVIL